jgi:predicted acyl esterase
MRVGVRLATDVYLPSVPGRLTAVLIRTPYDVSMRSSPGRRPRVIEMTNSASSLPFVSSLSSRPSCKRHVRHVVFLSSAETSVTVASG